MQKVLVMLPQFRSEKGKVKCCQVLTFVIWRFLIENSGQQNYDRYHNVKVPLAVVGKGKLLEAPLPMHLLHSLENYGVQFSAFK